MNMKPSTSALQAAATLRALLPSALLLFTAACSQQSPATTGAGAPAGADDRGAVLYAQNCVPCHREKGEGVPNVYPSVAGSPAVMGDPIELAQWVLSQKRPATIPAGRYPTQMLLFSWMKDEDAAALLTYIRSNFGNSAPPVDAAMVAKAREK
jgi:alcohol dehydrogenase (quinone), cytochrome c subunit